MQTRRRRGFTLLEVIVALALGVVVMITARAFVETVAQAGARVVRVAHAADGRANARRLLQATVARADVDSSAGRRFVGGPTALRFGTWCDVPSGWQEPCTAELVIAADDSGTVVTLVVLGAPPLAVAHDSLPVSFRYLSEEDGRLAWLPGWESAVAPPLAIGLATARDTVLLRVSTRG